MKARKHIYFSGCVQGVGFRYVAAMLARSLGLTGYVRNLWDGRVEMEVQGEARTIGEYLEELREQRYIVIEDMEIREIDMIKESGFTALSG